MADFSLNNRNPIAMRILLLILAVNACLFARAADTPAPVPAVQTEVNTALQPVSRLESDFYDWDQRHAQVLALQKTLDPEIVLIGDSITHLWGGVPAEPLARGTNSWAKTFGQRRVLNMGFGWDRTQNVLWRLDHGELDGTRPRVVVVNIGSNNFATTPNARENSPAEVAAAIAAICARVRQKIPACRILVMGVLPRGFEPGDAFRTNIRALNALLAQRLAGQPQTQFLAISRQIVADDAVLSRELMPDGVHPSEAGYAIWGKALIAAGVLK